MRNENEKRIEVAVRQQSSFRLLTRSFALGTAYAAALFLIAPVDSAEATELRGSTKEFEYSTQGTDLRGSRSELPPVENQNYTQYDNPHNDEEDSPGISASLRYLTENLLPSIFVRDGTRAISDRQISLPLPDRQALRHSMLHSDSLYDGLRGGVAGVGESMAAALRGSYSTKAQLERANAARARMHGAFAAFLPRVSSTVNANAASLNSFLGTSSANNDITAGIEITMPLYTSGVNLNSYRQSKHVSIASDLGYIAEEHRVALEAVAAHVNLRLNRRVERTLEKNVSAMRRIAHIASRLFEAGDASRTDIATARANVQRAKAELDIARRSRENTRTDYESLTNIAAPAELASGRVDHLVPASVDDAVDQAINHNPVLGSSLHTAIASRYAAKVERGRYGPQVNLYGRYDRALYGSTSTGSTHDVNVGVRLQVPLFDATISSSVGAARHDALEAEYLSLDQSRLIERQIRRQWSAYHSASRRVGIIRREVKAVSSSVTGARREYEAGFRSITDVLDAQVRLARAKITLENAIHERMLSAYELAFTTASPAIQNLTSGR